MEGFSLKRDLETLQEYLDIDIQLKKEWFDNEFTQSILAQYITGKELSEPQKNGLLKSIRYKVIKEKQEKLFDKDAEPTGQFVGKVKQRYDFILKYVSTNGTQRGFYVHKFIDRNENKFSMFSDNRQLFTEGEDWKSLEEGDVFKMRATVNRHSINDFPAGQSGPSRETVLNRPKINEFLGNKKNVKRMLGNDKE